MKIAYYNDRKLVKREKDKGFLGGYKSTYEDNYVKVKVLGKNISGPYNSAYYLVEFPNKKIKEVLKSDLFIGII